MMKGGNGIPNSLPILDAENWERCHKQMKSLFGLQDTLEVVTNGIAELAENAIEALSSRFSGVKSLIRLEPFNH